MMVNIFKGYTAAGDETFMRYMAQHKDAYDDGEDYTPEHIMSLALNRYTNLKHHNK